MTPDDNATDRRLDAMEQSIESLRGMFDAFAKESTQYRRESRHDLKCISETWAEYLPMFKMIQTREKKRDELTEKLKAHTIGWGIVAAIGAFVAILGEHVIRIFRG
jgi:DNA-binding protein H-NS